MEFRGSPQNSSFLYREGKEIKAEFWGEVTANACQIDAASLLPFGRTGQKTLPNGESQEILERITIACSFKYQGSTVEVYNGKNIK